jgi:hypothetical protein
MNRPTVVVAAGEVCAVCGAPFGYRLTGDNNTDLYHLPGVLYDDHRPVKPRPVDVGS